MVEETMASGMVEETMASCYPLLLIILFGYFKTLYDKTCELSDTL